MSALGFNSALPKGFEVTVPPAILLASAWFPFILNFYWRAVRLFFAFPGRISLTSWFRTPAVNRIEGGSPESQHLFGLAWDITAPQELYGELVVMARGLGLIAVEERDHVHLQLFPAGALARAGVRFPS